MVYGRRGGLAKPTWHDKTVDDAKTMLILTQPFPLDSVQTYTLASKVVMRVMNGGLHT